MLDPFSCLALATAVAQFIDFGSELLSVSRKVYQAGGQPETLREFEAQVSRFRLLARSLKVDTSDEEDDRSKWKKNFKSVGLSSLKRGDKEAELIRRDGHALVLVAEDCERLADQILSLLSELKIDGPVGKFQSLKLASKIAMKGRQLDEYERQIQDRKIDLSIHLVAALSTKQTATITSSHDNSIDQGSSTLIGLMDKVQGRDRDLRTMISGQLDGIRREILSLSEPLAFSAVNASTNPAKKKDDVRYNLLDMWNREHVAHIPPAQLSAKDLTGSLVKFNSEAMTVSRLQYLLLSFRYDTIRSREVAISSAHARTFEWILDQPANNGRGTSHGTPFLQWLRSESGLFWVSGKAGSGKSTLLKLLFEHPRTHSQLQKWAGNSKLVVSRHFFWNAGTSLQKSQLGLLRSLCYDIFCACPDLLHEVCGERLASLSPAKSLDPSLWEREPWTVLELSKTVAHLGRSDLRSQGRDVKFCFFIDGLDEYAGQHDEIVNNIATLALYSNVKICASSRPWNVFETAFGGQARQNRMLVLQDLTRNDIALYVKHKLEEDKRFKSMLGWDPRCGAIVDEITTRADGVFLWVVLVVGELLKSLNNDDDLSTLQRRLYQIPPGLDEYFQHMFDNLDSFYSAETAQMFRVAVEAPFYIPVIGYTVLQLNDPAARSIALELDQNVDSRTREDVTQRLRRRIQGRCRDLLEVQGTRVSFLHRTVKDFLSTPEMVELLDTRAGKGFDVDAVLCQISLVGMRYLSSFLVSATRSDAGTLKWLLPSFFHHARLLEAKLQQPPLDNLRTFEDIRATLNDGWIVELPEEPYLLAFMNLPLALQAYLDRCQPRWTPSSLSALVIRALYFLKDANPDDIEIPQELFAGMYDMDPDRRGFNMETVRMLLDQGADPRICWESWLRSIEDYPQCDADSRKRYLEVSYEIAKRGPKGKSFDMGALSNIFGRSDAQWLINVREQAVASSGWSPLSWVRRR